MTFILWMQVSDCQDSGAAVEQPVWSHVEERVRRAFTYGGTVHLNAGIYLPESDNKLVLKQFLGMDCCPGACRLLYTPGDEPIAEKTKRREWWEAGDTPFRGTTEFNDHEWDDRTICRDLSIAIDMFRDFFNHCDLTDFGVSQTRSVWEPKSR
jgi:hypothetical protein